jgi:predicted transcriptional regulator
MKTSLEIPPAAGHSIHMSTKEIVQDLLQKLPEDVSLHDVAQEIEFVAAVRQGLAEIDRGERIPIEEIERELPSWVFREPSHLPLDVTSETSSDTSRTTHPTGHSRLPGFW